MIIPVELDNYPTERFFDDARVAKKDRVFYVMRIDEAYTSTITNLIDVNRSNPAAHVNFFATIISDHVTHIFNGQSMSKESWIENMMRHYPEYMEWYLFNPELM